MSKIVLITGANSGIGFAIAKELAAAPEDFHVILAGRSIGKVDSAIAEIKATGHVKNGLSSLDIDVTKQITIQSAASTVKDKFGKLDVLINNAGICPEGLDVPTMFQTTLGTNVIGPVMVSDAFRSLLLASPAAYSIYIGSITSSLSHITNPKSYMHSTGAGTSAYRASKAAINMIAMHEQLEVAGTSLEVRVICPGFVVSNLRGTSEDARMGGGIAEDPATSARLVLSVIRGEREADAQKLITRDGGVCPW